MHRWSLLFAALVARALHAEIVFEKPRVDLGVVKAAGAVEHRFAFKVVGDQPAEIAEITDVTFAADGAVNENVT